uniref:Uncharacterized protein n=1 Tax=Anopheles atroparvus TaxID=41427 RepID=A0A182JH42_ANOAO
MIHHQPTKYHHANPLTHFLNLHTSHATAAAAAALALATDGLGQHHHGHHTHHGHPITGATASIQHLHPSSPQHYQHHQQMDGQRQLRTDAGGGTGQRGRPCKFESHTDEEEEEAQDESSNDRSCSDDRKRPRYDRAGEISQGEASESENNVDIDVDDPAPGEEEDRAALEFDREANGGERGATGRTPNAVRELTGVAERESSSFGEREEDDDDEEIVIDGKGAPEDGGYKVSEVDIDRSNRGGCTSPCTNDAGTAVLETDGFVGKSFTIAAILGLKKKQDEAAAAAAAAVGNEYSDAAMNLSTGATGFQPHQQHHQRAAAAAAVAAAAMGRLPLVMAAMEKRERADSVDSADACGGPLAYGVRPLSAGQHPPGAPGAGTLSALQNLHQLPGLHGADLTKKSTLSSSAASLKSKRVRTIFTPEQLERLEAEFERQQYMVGPERLYLAHTLQLTEAQVKVWFQNRRIKWRKHHLEITQQRLAMIRQRQIANGVPIASTPQGPQAHLSQQAQPQGSMSGGRMVNRIESPDLTICTDSMDARSASEGDD